VSEESLDRLGVDTLADQDGHRGVAEIVYSEALGKSRRLNCRPPDIGAEVRITHGRPVACREQQGVWLRWHCHILSHEDHEMMRVLEVGQS
jgi:hypothetical protein